jgi:hypothetical protein
LAPDNGFLSLPALSKIAAALLTFESELWLEEKSAALPSACRKAQAKAPQGTACRQPGFGTSPSLARCHF